MTPVGSKWDIKNPCDKSLYNHSSILAIQFNLSTRSITLMAADDKQMRSGIEMGGWCVCVCVCKDGEGRLIESSHANLGATQSVCCWTTNEDSLANTIPPPHFISSPATHFDQSLAHDSYSNK